VLFDTDIIIWIQRGNRNAAELVDAETNRAVSIITFMELLQHANDKLQQQLIKRYLTDMNFIVLPTTENIGHRALIYIEEYSSGYGLSTDDALIAATAVENNKTLVTGNYKHFKAIRELAMKRFIAR
jgi:predicted nucleic acid-binding protein